MGAGCSSKPKSKKTLRTFNNCYGSSGDPGCRNEGESVQRQHIMVRLVPMNVFAHNHVARALYEKTSFEITGIYMTKRLTR